MVVALGVIAAVLAFLVLPLLVGRRLGQVSAFYRSRRIRRLSRPYRRRQPVSSRPPRP